MTLALDARQRAMLEEMGIRLFEPGPRMPAGDAPPPARPTAARALAGTEVATNFIAEDDRPVRAAAGFSPEKAAEPLARAAEGIELLAWDTLAQTVAECRACNLCNGRRNTVFGAGDQQADWLFVGDAPGDAEDLQGQPFAGQEGQLLDNMLKALGLARGAKVYIANLLKCRPPGNRNPDAAEVAQCEPFLRRQIELLQPRVIVVMGKLAMQALLRTQEPVGQLRGRVHDYRGIPLVVTYPPAFLLRNLRDKGKAWADLCLALEVVAQAQPSPAG
jgi:uracil-DNA glycosylase family 4